MEETNGNGHASSLAVTLAGLGVAGVFEALTVLATQDKRVRAVSPWQDDPCDVANAVAGFVARPPRARPRRVAEASVVAGGVAVQVAVAFRAPLLPRSVEALGITVAFLIGSVVLNNVSAVHDITVILPVHYWMRWTQLFGGDVGQLLPGLAAQAAAIAVALAAGCLLLARRDPAA